MYIYWDFHLFCWILEHSRVVHQQTAIFKHLVFVFVFLVETFEFQFLICVCVSSFSLGFEECRSKKYSKVSKYLSFCNPSPSSRFNLCNEKLFFTYVELFLNLFLVIRCCVIKTLLDGLAYLVSVIIDVALMLNIGCPRDHPVCNFFKPQWWQPVKLRGSWLSFNLYSLHLSQRKSHSLLVFGPRLNPTQYPDD